MGVRVVLIRLVTFLGGLYFFLKFVLPEASGFSQYHEQISDGFVLVGAMALALGLINLLMVHGSRLLYLRRGWSASTALLFGLFLMLTVTFLDWQATSGIYRNTERLLVLKQFSEGIVSDAAEGIVPKYEAAHVSENAAALGALAIAPRTPEVRVQFLRHALDDLLPTIEHERDEAVARVRAHGGTAELALLDRAEKEYVEALQVLQSARVQIPSELPVVGGVVGGVVEGVGQESAPVVFSGEPVLALGRALGKVASAYQGLQEASYRTSLLRRIYSVLFDGFFISLGAAMFSLLGFYICAAAYRAFRVRSMESLLMMMAALLVMLGQIPFGLWISDSLPEVRLWLLQVPSTGAARAIEIGASVAGLVMAFRMWLSIESESFK